MDWLTLITCFSWGSPDFATFFHHDKVSPGLVTWLVYLIMRHGRNLYCETRGLCSSGSVLTVISSFGFQQNEYFRSKLTYLKLTIFPKFQVWLFCCKKEENLIYFEVKRFFFSSNVQIYCMYIFFHCGFATFQAPFRGLWGERKIVFTWKDFSSYKYIKIHSAFIKNYSFNASLRLLSIALP